MTPTKARAVARLMLPLAQSARVSVEAVLDAADAVAVFPTPVKAWTARTLQWAMAQGIQDPETLEGIVADVACNAVTATLCEMEGQSQNGLRDICCELVAAAVERVKLASSVSARHHEVDAERAKAKGYEALAKAEYEKAFNAASWVAVLEQSPQFRWRALWDAMKLANACDAPLEALRVAKLSLTAAGEAGAAVTDKERALMADVVKTLETQVRERYPHLREGDIP
jgi:hypothetical protein